MARTHGAKNTMAKCPGSGWPMAGNMDRCLECGRVRADDGTPILRPDGVARSHMPISKKKRRQLGLIG